MPLIKVPKTTDRNTAARRRNGRKSRGAITPAGKERIRDANLKHGYYSQQRNEALVALGEDPAELAVLMVGAQEQWQPANDDQGAMVEELVRLRWRIRRSERMQESIAAEYVRDAEARREEQALATRGPFVDAVDFLDGLVAHVARPDFYAYAGLFREHRDIFKRSLESHGESILELLHRLRKPRQKVPAASGVPADATSDEDWEYLLAQEDDDDFPHPHPEIAVAEGEERDKLRAELLAVTAYEQQCFEDGMERFALESQPLTPGERDQLASNVNQKIDLMRRQEDACYRNFFRLGNFLIKIQDRREAMAGERESGSGEADGRKQKTKGEGWETKAGSREATGPVPRSEAVLSHAVPAPDAELRITNVGSPAAKCRNEGDSGDVDENTEGGKKVSGAGCQVPVATRQDSQLENELDSPLPDVTAPERAA